MIVAMLLFSMITLIVIGVLSPATKIFVRMQRLQYAQIILDNTVDELRTIVQEATEYVKIYEEAKADTPGDIISTGTDEDNGKDSGLALEFLNLQGYVVLISTQGCGETTIVRGGKLTDQEMEAQSSGRLLTRYYAREAGDNSLYLYTDNDGATLISRAVSSVFPEGYYMGNYLKITFSYQDASGNKISLSEGTTVNFLVADVELYSGIDCKEGELVVRDSVILDFKYPVVCKKAPTAKAAPDALEHY